MEDIKAVLQGKTFDAVTGTVDHSSEPITPHLKVFIVSYDHQMTNFDPASPASKLLADGIVGGISFWISGPSQDAKYNLLENYVQQLRDKLRVLGVSSMPIMTGTYLTYSSIGWMKPGPFWSLVEAARTLVDTGTVQGTYIFAGSVLSDMNKTIWDGFDFSNNLDRMYFPYVGEVSVEAVDAKTSAPIYQSISVTVRYPGPKGYLVAHKVTPIGTASTAGLTFGGTTAGEHGVTVSSDGYVDGTATVRCVTGNITKLTVKLAKIQ